jgi:hypothetical protein
MGFESTIAEGERPQTYALDRSYLKVGSYKLIIHYNYTREHTARRVWNSL